MNFEAIKDSVEGIHENHVEDVANAEYTEVHREVMEQLAQDDPDLEELETVLRQYTDAVRALAPELGGSAVGENEMFVAEASSCESDLEKLESQIDTLGRPELSSYDEESPEIEADDELDHSHQL
jgi:hypothetical protein